MAVLGLTGMDLIFFIALHMMLWFRLVSKTVLVMYQCFSCC